MSNTWSQDLYIQAYRFAAHAHLGQTVPGSDLPYITHVSLVSIEVLAALAAEPEHDGNLAIQCALLHDVIEDTPITYEQVEATFGTAVAQGVQALTKDPSLERSQQMSDSLQRIQAQPREVWLVKLADRIANLEPPPHYWTKEKIAWYREEARDIYTALYSASTFLATRLLEKIALYREYL